MKAMINRARNRAAIFTLYVSISTVFIVGAAGSHLSNQRSVARSDSGKTHSSSPSRITSARVRETYGKLPMRFEANQGQSGEEARFLSRGAGYSLFLTPNEAVLRLRIEEGAPYSTDPTNPQSAIRNPQSAIRDPQSAVLRMKLVGANGKPRISGVELLQTTSNYFVGNDPGRWRTNVANFAKVKYESVYPGVDLVWYGNQGQLEHDFIIAPGADPTRIKLSFAGADAMIDGRRALVLRPDGNRDGEVARLLKPVAWQEADDGKRREIACDYRIVKKDQVVFRLGEYDRSRTLVIDPVLAYSTYIGGAGVDQAVDIAVDGDGFAYITGQTDSADFPGPSPIQSVKGAQSDVFVLKINQAGSAVVYGAWLGGQSSEAGAEIAVNAAGDVFIAGGTASDNFPTKNALQPARKGGNDAFVARLNSAGNDLVYSTYLGGSLSDSAAGLALDASGAVYLTGATDSLDFPLTGAFQTTKKGSAVYSTTNGAGDWNESGAGMNVSQVNDIAFDPKTPTTIYAGSERGLFKSSDSGGSWARIGGDQFNFFITLIAIDPVTPATIYALAGSLPYKSVDGGATWNRITSVPTLQTLVIDPATPATLFGASTSGQPFKSVDGGANWTPFNIRVPFGSQFAQIRSFAIDPANSSTIYAGGTGGVYKSTDGGTTWAPLPNGFPFGGSFTVSRLAISRSDPAVLFAQISFGGFFKTTNGGANWSPINFPGPLSTQSAIAIDPTNANTVYIGTTGAGVYKTTDGGATWNTVNNGLSGSNVRAIAIHPNTPSTVYAGTLSGADVFVAKLNPAGAALVYSSYLGGSGIDSASGIRADSSGNAYVAGLTQSQNFPAVSPYQSSLKGLSDAFVAKINAAGSAVSWSTYLGGAGSENANDIAIGPADSVIVAGITSSTDFPTAKAFQPQNRSVGPAAVDGFITRFSADGSKLDFSTYLGGAGFDVVGGIAADAAGNVYATGFTDSANFPVLYAPQPARGGDPQFPNPDAFATKLNSDGSSLVYSTYLGGNGFDQGTGIAVDGMNNAYVTGIARSPDFPTTPNPLRGPGPNDSFVTKLSINADLAISISDLPDPVMVNNQLSYTLTVANNGPDPAAGVTVTDTLPNGVLVVSLTPSQGSCSGSSAINCDLGNLGASGRATITIVGVPSATGAITNRATVTSATPDANAANNSAQQETRVSTSPSIYGRVATGSGDAASGVTVSLTGAQRPAATTGGDGGYQFAELSPGANYTVTPARQGYVFNPPSRALNNLTADQRADFTAVACAFTITPRSLSFPATGGTGSVTITSPDPQCQWTARSNSTWITITSPASGAGDGIVTFTVAPTVGSRGGSLTIAGNTLSVNQEFNACAESDFLAPKTFALKDVSARYRAPRYAVKDFNSDGRLDIVFLTEAFGSSSGTGAAIALGNDSGGFNQQTQIFLSSGGEFVSALAVNDFNGDGKLDLAMTSGSGSGGKVLISLGDGAGRFGAPASYTVSDGAFSIAVGDFNGDGKPDVAAAAATRGKVAVLLNRGAGDLDAPKTVDLSPFNSVSALAASDFNGDGKDDLAVIDSYQNLVTLIGDGSGGFGARTTQTIPNNAEFVMAGDFTGDGKNDVAVAAANVVSLRAGNGAGAFDAPLDYAFGRAVHWAIAEDLNRDGRIDLAASNVNGVTIRFGQSQGRFGEPVTYLNGTIHDNSFNKTSIAAADFNRDGWPDIFSIGLIGSSESQSTATSGSVGLSILPGVGQGRFAAPRGFDFLDPRAFSLGAELAAGDLNGDGAPDLALAYGSDSVIVMLNNGLGELTQPRRYPVGSVPRRIRLSDFNRDGKPDIAVLNFNSSSVTLLINNGKGEFPLAVQIATGQNPRALGVADFNNDGKPDLIVKSATSGLALLIGDGNLAFTKSADNLASDIQNAVVTTGDFNGDGNYDFVVNNPNPDSTGQDCALSGDKFAFYAGDGKGGFMLSASLTLREKPRSLLVADINGDGRDDLVFSTNCYESQGLYSMLADGQGGFAQPVKYSVGSNAVNSLSAALGDFNGDGRLDAAVANANTGNVSVLLGKGDGGFDAPVLLPLAAITSYMAAADFDGDGSTDLAVSRGESDSIAVLLNRASCPPQGWAVNTSAASFFRYRLAGASIAALFGAGLASGTQSATSLPLPTTLANASVKFKDAAGAEQLAPLFFVSPDQINYLVPERTAPGAALVTVMNGANAVASGTTLIATTSPGLFSADSSGQGLAAAVVLRVRQDNSQVYEPMVRFDSAQNRFVAIPIDLSDASEQVFLILFGTGLRNHGGQANVNAKIGGENSQVLFAGPQGGFDGLDQINVHVTRALAGRGMVDVVVTVEGRATNVIGVNIK